MDMNRIEKQARYYRNLPLRDRSIKAVVHLEDSEDILFWKHQLQSVSPANYRFLSYSKNDKGNDTRGCAPCLRYKTYLTKNFFICIDSDLRLLRGEEGLTADNYIVQTYTYSWENHFCENITKFNACLPLQPKRDELADNGNDYVERVAHLFEDALADLPQFEPKVFENLDETNAYLHIQGHQLYKLVLYIGTMLCHGKGVAFKTDILDKAYHTEGYLEIVNVQSDLKQITSEE